MVVFAQEGLKLIFSVCIFLATEGSISSLRVQLFTHKSLMVLYVVPAVLYSVYNNLTFVGLEIFDPATYFVLMQFRVVFTAIMSVLILGKLFSKNEWLGLIVIMFGAMFKELPHYLFASTSPAGWGYLIILIQLCMSTLAGVFNEKLLKSDASPNIQNIYMYSNSMWINVLFVFFRSSAKASQQIVSTNTAIIYIIPIVVNAACLGVLTGFFLKHLSSVLKSIASAIELWTTAILSAIIFGYSIDASTVAGIAIVSIGIYIYSKPKPTNVRLGSVDALELASSPKVRE